MASKRDETLDEWHTVLDQSTIDNDHYHSLPVDTSKNKSLFERSKKSKKSTKTSDKSCYVNIKPATADFSCSFPEVQTDVNQTRLPTTTTTTIGGGIGNFSHNKTDFSRSLSPSRREEIPSISHNKTDVSRSLSPSRRGEIASSPFNKTDSSRPLSPSRREEIASTHHDKTDFSRSLSPSRREEIASIPHDKTDFNPPLTSSIKETELDYFPHNKTEVNQPPLGTTTTTKEDFSLLTTTTTTTTTEDMFRCYCKGRRYSSKCRIDKKNDTINKDATIKCSVCFCPEIVKKK